ncbi:unnamed protein product, partial [marine sediment metagenome]
RLLRRRLHVRKTVVGTPERPRLALCRSNKHIHCQIIDDYQGHTLVSMTTTKKDIREETAGKRSVETAREMGKRFGALALEKGIEKVVFDRAGRKFHGRVKAFAEGARESGLKF